MEPASAGPSSDGTIQALERSAPIRPWSSGGKPALSRSRVPLKGEDSAAGIAGF